MNWLAVELTLDMCNHIVLTFTPWKNGTMEHNNREILKIFSPELCLQV